MPYTTEGYRHNSKECIVTNPETSSPTHHGTSAVRIKSEQEEGSHYGITKHMTYFLQQGTTFLLSQSFRNGFSNLPKLLPAGDKF